MAIEVRHSPSARTAATANYEAALLQWGEAERRRQLAEQLQRDQMAQQADLSREGMSLQDLMQRRSIADAQKRQLVGLQGQYGLQDDQQMYNAEQAFYDRNQQLGLTQLGQAYSVENREDQQLFNAGQNQLNRDNQMALAQSNQQFQRQNNLDRIDEIKLRHNLDIEEENVKYDAGVRRQLEQFDREQEAVDAAYNNGQLTPQEYEQATRQVEQRRMNVQLKPPAPESRPEDEIVPYGGSYVMRNPETGQWEFARNAPKQDEAKDPITPQMVSRFVESFIQENGRPPMQSDINNWANPIRAAFQSPATPSQVAGQMVGGMGGAAITAAMGQAQGPPVPAPEPTPEQITQTTNTYGQALQGVAPEAVKALAVKSPEVQDKLIKLFPGQATALLSDFMLLPPNVQGDVLEAARLDYETWASAPPEAKDSALAQYVLVLSQAIAQAAQPQGALQ